MSICACPPARARSLCTVPESEHGGACLESEHVPDLEHEAECPEIGQAQPGRSPSFPSRRKARIPRPNHASIEAVRKGGIREVSLLVLEGLYVHGPHDARLTPLQCRDIDREYERRLSNRELRRRDPGYQFPIRQYETP
jgi:hypothetical protein